MFRTILVPLDGSPFGEAALPLALSIARQAGAALRLVHVMAPLGTIYSEAPVYLDPNLERELREHQRRQHQQMLDRLADRLRGLGVVAVQTALLEGDTAGSIRAHAAQISADLVVMTTYARGPMGRFWLGGVADELIRKLPMPLLLVRPGEEATKWEPEPQLRHVLIPLDGSLLAEQIIEPALALGGLMHADYTLLRVIHPVFPSTYPVESAGMSQVAESLIERTRVIQDQVRREAQDYLEKIAVGLRQRGLNVLTRVEVDDGAAVAILEHSKTGDLVAMCTHGRKGLSRLFLGSVTDKVIRGGHVPVLVHRPADGANAPK
jgi:nucleotide-binding universal stress UspA family protein